MFIDQFSRLIDL